jgi:hypothetical protein
MYFTLTMDIGQLLMWYENLVLRFITLHYRRASGIQLATFVTFCHRLDILLALSL